MEKKESEFVAYSVLSENECGKGTYTLEVADRINEVRHSIYKNRRDKENIEAYVV